MGRKLWDALRRRLRQAKLLLKATCQRAFILRFVLLVVSGGVVALNALTKLPPESNTFGVMMSTVVTPGAAGTAFLLLFTVLGAQAIRKPCSPPLTLVWDSVVIVLWVVLLITRSVWLMLYWETPDEDADANAKNLGEERDISTEDTSEVTYGVLEEGLLLLLPVGAVVGHAAQAWLDIGETLRARRSRYIQALERQRERLELERRVALRRFRELHQPPPHVHLSQLPAAPRTLMRLSEGRLPGLSSLSQDPSARTLSSARGSASFEFSLPYPPLLTDSEERLLREVMFQEHEAPRSQSPSIESGSVEELKGGPPRLAFVARSQPSSSGLSFDRPPQGAQRPQDDERQRQKHTLPQVIYEHPLEGPQPPPRGDRFQGPPLPQDDERQLRQQHTVPQITLEQPPEGMPKRSVPQSLCPETPELQESTQVSKKKHTACGKCSPPAKTTTYEPPLLRNSKNAMDLSKGVLPDAVVPQGQHLQHPYHRNYQSEQIGQLPIEGRIAQEMSPCCCPENVGKPGTERGDFHEHPTQDQHLNQLESQSSYSLRNSLTKEPQARKLTIVSEIIEIKDNLQNQLLKKSQIPNQENNDSQNQEVNVHSSEDARTSISKSTTTSTVKPTASTTSSIASI